MERAAMSEPVELFQKWYPGGAAGGEARFLDGVQYLFAIWMADEKWQFVAVYAHATDEGGWGWEFANEDGDSCTWAWDEVDWYAEVGDFDLPIPGMPNPSLDWS